MALVHNIINRSMHINVGEGHPYQIIIINTALPQFKIEFN